FKGVVDAFAERMGEWYFEPIRYYRHTMNDPGHFAFDVMAVDCLIIDAMSQFVFGELSSEGSVFMRFVEKYLPNFKGTLTVPIEHHSFQKRNGQLQILNKHLTTIEAVIWSGFRCGILHHSSFAEQTYSFPLITSLSMPRSLCMFT